MPALAKVGNFDVYFEHNSVHYVNDENDGEVRRLTSGAGLNCCRSPSIPEAVLTCLFNGIGNTCPMVGSVPMYVTWQLLSSRHSDLLKSIEGGRVDGQ